MSIQSEITRITNNVQDTITAIEETGVTVPADANSDDLPSLAAALANEKQDKLTGTEGQIVGFNASGEAVAQEPPATGMTQTEADARYMKLTGAELAAGETFTLSGDSSDGEIILKNFFMDDDSISLNLGALTTGLATQNSVRLSKTGVGIATRNFTVAAITDGAEVLSARPNDRMVDMPIAQYLRLGKKIELEAPIYGSANPSIKFYEDYTLDSAEVLGELEFIAEMDSSTTVIVRGIGTPENDDDAVPKSYVDTAVSAKASKPTRVAVTLSTSAWSSNAQTVTVTGILADETAQLIQPVPAIASQSAYYAAGIMCTGQEANSLTFTCQETPTADLTVYVVIQEVSA